MSLEIKQLSIKYEKKIAVKEVSFSVKNQAITTLIGPNGSGKSTILTAIAGKNKNFKGSINFDGHSITSFSQKNKAKLIGLLHQKNSAPNDITVKDLVSYGRYPHRKWYQKENIKDLEAIEWALENTNTIEFSEQKISELSGGEAQRVWLAMLLAQQPKILLLDEPTTYLDVAHQHEILELIREINKKLCITILMVLHDLNQAAYFSDHIITLSKGKIFQCGNVQETFTKEMIQEVYKMNAEISTCPIRLCPRINLINSLKTSTQIQGNI